SPKSTDDSVSLAVDGTDVNDVESQSSALTAAFTLGTGDFTHPVASVKAASNVAGFFTPQSCIVADADLDALTVKYTLSGCTGPWGLVKVSGVVTVVYSASTDGSGLALDVTGTALEFDTSRAKHGKANLHATATATSNGGAREMKWNASLDGTTARGNAFTRDADWDVTWQVGESCIALDGTAQGQVNNRGLKTDVTSYQRCQGECPAAGGVITISNDAGQQISLTFDGSAKATFTAADDQQTQIDLACGF
ncbi:MAG TPA: hypothetical protein VF407_24125, partial [Polyangiaceae bacterium]